MISKTIVNSQSNNCHIIFTGIHRGNRREISEKLREKSQKNSRRNFQKKCRRRSKRNLQRGADDFFFSRNCPRNFYWIENDFKSIFKGIDQIYLQNTDKYFKRIAPETFKKRFRKKLENIVGILKNSQWNYRTILQRNSKSNVFKKMWSNFQRCCLSSVQEIFEKISKQFLKKLRKNFWKTF